MITVKLVSSQQGANNYYLWDLSNSPTPYTASATGVLDADGINYDYFFSGYGMSLKNGCGTVYYSNSQVGDGNGSYDPTVGTWATAITACPCPMAPIAQCFSDDGTGLITILLSYPINVNVFLWSHAGPGATKYTSPLPTQDMSGNFNYTYVIPTSDIPGYVPGQTSCLSFYVANQSAGDTDPEDFANTIRICPCCPQGTQNSYISYMLNTEATNPLTVAFSSPIQATFDFGDGTPQPFGTHEQHTYAAAGTYPVVITNAVRLGTPSCTKTDVICLTGNPVVNPIILSATPNVYCDANYTTTINGNSVLVTPLPPTYTSFNGPLGTGYSVSALIGVDWGDGSTGVTFAPPGSLVSPAYPVSHIYNVPGTYTICATGNALNCQTCMDICIDDADHNAQRPAPQTPTTPINTVQQLVQGIDLYPNPATDAATLTFNLQNDAVVKIDVVDVVGRVVDAVTNITMAAGNQKITIATGNLASGVYNVTIQTDKGTTTKRLSVVR